MGIAYEMLIGDGASIWMVSSLQDRSSEERPMKHQLKAIRSTFAAVIRWFIPSLVGIGIIAAAHAADFQKPQSPTVMPKMHPEVIHAPKMLPDLAVGRAAFDGDCSIRITLRNRSKGTITMDQYSRLTMETTWRPMSPRGATSQTSRRRLTEMDRHGLLRKAGGAISVSTGVYLRGDHYINVLIDDGRKLRELDEANNTFAGVVTAPDTCR